MFPGTCQHVSTIQSPFLTHKPHAQINDPAICARIHFGMIRSASTLVLSTEDESESGGCWLHPGVSPPGDAVLQLDDESNSVLESGCMFSA